jgi:hypothetical protein
VAVADGGGFNPNSGGPSMVGEMLLYPDVDYSQPIQPFAQPDPNSQPTWQGGMIEGQKYVLDPATNTMVPVDSFVPRGNFDNSFTVVSEMRDGREYLVAQPTDMPDVGLEHTNNPNYRPLSEAETVAIYQRDQNLGTKHWASNKARKDLAGNLSGARNSPLLGGGSGGGDGRVKVGIGAMLSLSGRVTRLGDGIGNTSKPIDGVGKKVSPQDSVKYLAEDDFGMRAADHARRAGESAKDLASRLSAAAFGFQDGDLSIGGRFNSLSGSGSSSQFTF